MDLSLLRHFRAVYRVGSIREASLELHIAPSALSRKILKLEAMLGTPLFERYARGMRPTAAGEVFATFVRNTLLDLDRARVELEALKGLKTGHVRILSTEGLVGNFLMPAINAFGRAHPEISFELLLTGTDLVTDGILRGNADIGIAFNAEAKTQLDFRMRLSDPLTVVMAPEHRLADSASLSLHDLADERIALPAPSFGIRRLIDEECKAAKVHLNLAMHTNSIEALRSFTRFGAGISFLPRLAIRAELDAGKLVSIPLEEPSFRRTAHDVCVLAGRSLPPAVLSFLDYLKRTAEGNVDKLADGKIFSAETIERR